MYDLIILGAGPAGLTAQVYALRYNLKVLTIGGIVGGLMTETHKICNWPSEIAISGQALMQKMYDQVKAMNGEIVIEEIAEIIKLDNGWQVNTLGKKIFTAKALLFTLGTAHRKLGLLNEDNFFGRGLTYCVTCDGPFYKGKTVAVVGGGNSAKTAALYLADLCPKVYLIYRGATLRGEEILSNEISKRSNIISLKETKVIGLIGENKLEKISLDKSFEDKTELEVDGIFIEIGNQPKVKLFKAVGGEIDDQGRIKVKIDQSTNLPLFWAAGDVTDGSNGFRQIITACSEGAIAADSIYKFLRSDYAIK